MATHLTREKGFPYCGRVPPAIANMTTRRQDVTCRWCLRKLSWEEDGRSLGPMPSSRTAQQAARMERLLRIEEAAKRVVDSAAGAEEMDALRQAIDCGEEL